MQSAKDMCHTMMRAKIAVSIIDIANTEAQFVRKQLATLMQLKADLLLSSTNIIAGSFMSPRHDPDHMKLLTCFSSLVTALVSKLSSLETSSSPTTAANTSTISAYLIFERLWSLLFVTCNAFHSWPRLWPVREPSEYKPIREALHTMLSFLLRITRERGRLWRDLTDATDPENRHHQAYAVFCVPLTYITTIGVWPAASMMREMGSLPCEFFSLQCCATLEQLVDVDLHAANARTKQPTPPRLPSDTPSLSLTVIYICDALCNLIRNMLVYDNQDYIHHFGAPAVMQLFKRSIMLRSEQRHNAAAGSRASTAYNDGNSVALLRSFVNSSVERNSTSEFHPSLKVFLSACKDGGTQMQPIFTPRVRVCEVQLLSVLCGFLPKEEDLFEQRYELMVAVMNSWRPKGRADQPFPVPSVTDQISGVYVAAHHCSAETLAWMRGQQEQRQVQLQLQTQSQLQLQPTLKSSKRSSSHAALAAQKSTLLAPGVVALATHLYRNMSMRERLGNLEQAHELELPLVKSDWGPQLMGLRAFFLLPGSVGMLEATLRDVHGPRTAEQICEAMFWTTKTLVMPYETDHPDTIPACTSLAATMRKLISSLLRPAYTSNNTSSKLQIDQRGDLRQQHTQQPFLSKEDKLVVSSKLAGMMADHHKVVTTLDTFKLLDSTPMVMRLGSTYHTGVHLQTTSRIRSPARTHQTHQLVAVLLVSWVQMCHARLQEDRASGSSTRQGQRPNWLEEVAPTMRTLSESMNGMVESLLLSCKYPLPTLASVDSSWEKYGLKHFHGRLVPGCCYLGCTNLGGVCEAALKTLLCGGCKRARYCSKECQGAAWVEGGHSLVCKA